MKLNLTRFTGHYRRALAIIAALMIVGLAPSATRAQSGIVVGSGSPESCNEDALNSAFQAARNQNGGTITFNCGGGNHTIRLTSQKRLSGNNANFVVDGGGRITLDGQNQTRILYIGSNVRFTLRNIALVNGRAQGDPSGERAANQGGGIYSGYNNHLTFVNVTFRNNVATGTGASWHGGGALRIDDGSRVLIQNSHFENNRGHSGGAINNLISILTIEDSVFVNNHATDNGGGGGGAIYNDMGKMTIRTSRFTGNTAVHLGGGIYSWANDSSKPAFSGRVLIANTLINENSVTSSTANGGGIYHGGKNRLILRRSTLAHNVAARNGAGLFATNNTHIQIVNSTISGNRLPVMGVGAGLAISNSTANFQNVTIAKNFIGSDNGSSGAGLHINNTTLNMRNSIIADNVGGWRNCGGNGTLINRGGNVQFPGDTCGSGIRVANPRLNDLAYNGGHTPTHSLRSDSQAIRRGSHCAKVDQRGVQRPSRCDSGAFQTQGSAPASFSLIYPQSETNRAEPVIRWGAAAGAANYTVVLINPNNHKVLHRYRADAHVFNCAAECQYSLAGSGVTLRDGRRYTVRIVARNAYGNRNASHTFRVRF